MGWHTSCLDAAVRSIISGMLNIKSPRDAALELQRNPILWPGTDERFTGYGVIGLPFASGHYLALRNMAATSIGPRLSKCLASRAGRPMDLYRRCRTGTKFCLGDFWLPQRGLFVVAN